MRGVQHRKMILSTTAGMLVANSAAGDLYSLSRGGWVGDEPFDHQSVAVPRCETGIPDRLFAPGSATTPYMPWCTESAINWLRHADLLQPWSCALWQKVCSGKGSPSNDPSFKSVTSVNWCNLLHIDELRSARYQMLGQLF